MNPITAEQLNEKLKLNEEILILDVRSEDKYEKGHIEGHNIHSVNIPKTRIFEMETTNSDSLKELPKNQEIIVTCTTGNSAKRCAAILLEKHYDVTVLEGGVTAWKEYQDLKKG